MQKNSRHIIGMVLAAFVFVMSVSSLGRFVHTFASASLATKPEVISFMPYPGTFELESKDDTVDVIMFSMIGADIWYTDNGSNPVSGHWLDTGNPDLKHYGGYSIPVSKTTTFRAVGITTDGLLNDVQTARYIIRPVGSVVKTEVKKEIKVDPNRVVPKVVYSRAAQIDNREPKQAVLPVSAPPDIVLTPQPRSLGIRESAVRREQTADILTRAREWNENNIHIIETESGGKLRVFRVAQYGSR